MTTRRDFFIASSGLSVMVISGCALPIIPKRPTPSLSDALGWIRHNAGRFTLLVPRMEMGQNVLSALRQIACQELGVDESRVQVRMPSTSEIDRVRATVGSESIKDFALPLAQACATLREALEQGHTTGQLAPKSFPAQALRSMRPGAFVGKPALNAQTEAIVRGAPIFASDVRRPGMVYGRVLRAAAAPDIASRLTAMNEQQARVVKGFVALVRDERLQSGRRDAVGIVAATPSSLDAVEQALQAQWTFDTSISQENLDQALALDTRLASAPRLSHRVHDERIAESQAWEVDLRISVPLAAHAAIEPRVAVASFDEGGALTVWTGTQDAFYQRDVISKRMGLEADRIIIVPQRAGGAFGGKTLCTVELEAALLARSVGRPVKVQWTRAQEFRQGFHRPASKHRIRASVQQGRLNQWWHAFSSNHVFFTNAVLEPRLQRVTDWLGDDGVARGAALVYSAQAKRTCFDLARSPAWTGPWRGLGAAPNGLAMEMAIDACARVAGMDPLAFRLQHLEAEPRLARCLNQVARISQWLAAARSVSASHLRGRGLACGIYKKTSYAAVVAEIEIERATGSVRIAQLWCVHDCGLVINPDQVKAQCEGNLVWSVGMVLSDALTVNQGIIEADSFAQAPIPRYPDVPPMDIALIDSTEAPTGAGETVMACGAAAIANAITHALGQPVTRLPVLPQQIQELLKA